jgi:hypothetical protein
MEREKVETEAWREFQKIVEKLPEPIKSALQKENEEVEKSIQKMINLEKSLQSPSLQEVEKLYLENSEAIKTEIVEKQLVTSAKWITNKQFHFPEQEVTQALQIILIEYANRRWPDFAQEIEKLPEEEKVQKIIKKCISEGEEKDIDLALYATKHFLSGRDKIQALKEITKKYIEIEIGKWFRSPFLLRGETIFLSKAKEAVELLPEKEKIRMMKEIEKTEKECSENVNKFYIKNK